LVRACAPAHPAHSNPAKIKKSGSDTISPICSFERR